MNPAKRILSSTFETLGISRALLALQARRPHIRALNYHDVPPSRAGDFERHLRFYRERFVPAGRTEVEALLRGEWPHERPGLLLSFDDGLRSHAEVVAPLLEEYGFPGWFAVPTGFVDASPTEQAAYAEAHHIHFAAEYPDPRGALSWEQLRRLDSKHVIGCHTASHQRLRSDLEPSRLEAEIAGSKARLEAELGHDVDVFVWVGGEEWAYSAEAARKIGQCGFRIGLMTNNAPIRPGQDPLQMQRTNVEAWDPDPLVHFQLSGFLDLCYLPKRRRVNRLTTLEA